MQIVDGPMVRARFDRTRMCACACVVSLLVTLSASGRASAQVILGADVTLATQSIRHGLPRVNAAVLQPSAYVALRAGGGFITAGGWAEHELGGTEAGDRTLVGIGRTGIGSVEGWVEYAARTDVVDWRVGFVHVRYRNDARVAGIPADLSTGELYGELRTRYLPVTVAVIAFHDLDAFDGQYIELDVAYPLRTNPLGTVIGSIFLGGRAGLSNGLDPDDADDAAPWYFDDDGFTHADLYAELGVDVPLSWLPIDVFLSVHREFGIDDAVRRKGWEADSPTRSGFWWFEVAASTSVSLGGRRP